MAEKLIRRNIRMRNLKRALSLTLASVMLLGMMVLGTSAAAAYPDVTDEHNVEAIGVLQAVGVMSGSNNGNFNPDAKISRIEMAIVMANLLDLDVDYFQGQNTFSDVPAWASGYVNACAAHGIVTGVGGGRFGTGNVTATQAALMMLKALGYFQYNSDFGGDWARATALQASKIRLFDGIDAQDNTQLDRNQVAQLALNALKADMVDPDASGKLDITTPDGTTVSNGNVNYVVRTTDAAFANAIDDSATSNSGSSIDGRSGKIIQLGEQLYNGDLKLDKDVPDDFGRPSNTWTYKNDKIGTYANKTERIASYDTKVSRGDLYSLLSSTVRKSLSDGDSDLTVWVDGVEINGTNAATYGALSPAAPGNYWDRANSAAVYTMPNTTGTSRRGTLTEVYLDKDNNVDIAIINTYVFKATGDYSSSRDEVRVAPTADTKITLADLAIKGEDLYVENVKDGDYLLITGTRNANGTYEAKTLAVAEKVQGTVSTYTKNDTVTIGETKYSYSAICTTTGGKVDTKGTDYTVGQDAIVVLDSFGNIIAVDEARASSSFVFIDEIASTSGLNTKAVASAYFTDGVEAEITLKEINNVKSANTIISNTSYEHKWYNYSVGENGEYTLYNVNTTKYPNTTQSATAVSNDEANANDVVSAVLMESGKVDFLYNSTDGSKTATGKLGNDKTIAVVKDNVGDVSAYNGVKAIPDISVKGSSPVTSDAKTTAKAYYLANNNGYIDYVFVNVDGLNASVTGGEEDTSFLYVAKSKDPVYVNNSRTYWPHETVDAEGNKTVSNFDGALTNRLTKPNASVDGVYDLYYKTRTDGNGDITNEVKVATGVNDKYFNEAVTSGSVKIEGNALKITNVSNISGNFMLNSNSKIVVVALKGTGINLDTSADYGVYYCPAGSGLESYFNGYTFSGRIAGATLSDSSEYVDTMFITVESRTADSGSFSMTFSPVSASVEVNSTTTVTYSTANATGFTIGTPRSSDESIATVSTAGQTITITGVKVGATTVVVPVSNSAGVAMNQSFTVTVTAAATPAEKVAAAKKAIEDMGTAADDHSDEVVAPASEDAAKAAILQAVKDAVGSNASVSITYGTYAAPVNGTLANLAGEDKEYKATITITNGTETQTVEKTFTLKAQPLEGDALKAAANAEVAKKAEDLANSATLSGVTSGKVTDGLSNTTNKKAITVTGTGVTKPTGESNLSDELGFLASDGYVAKNYVITAVGFRAPNYAKGVTTGNGIKYNAESTEHPGRVKDLLLYIPLKINEAGNGVENREVTIQWYLDKDCTIAMGDPITYTIDASGITFAGT